MTPDLAEDAAAAASLSPHTEHVQHTKVIEDLRKHKRPRRRRRCAGNLGCTRQPVKNLSHQRFRLRRWWCRQAKSCRTARAARETKSRPLRRSRLRAPQKLTMSFEIRFNEQYIYCLMNILWISFENCVVFGAYCLVCYWAYCPYCCASSDFICIMKRTLHFPFLPGEAKANISDSSPKCKMRGWQLRVRYGEKCTGKQRSEIEAKE